MAGIYVYSDQSRITAELISFARQTGAAAFALCFSIEQAKAIKDFGADKVYVLQGGSPLVENYGRAVADFLKSQGADLFLVGATARGRDIASRVAGHSDCGMVSDVSSVSWTEGRVSCERLMYGGAVIQEELLSGFCVVSIPAGKFEAETGESSEIVVVEVEADNRVILVDTAPIVREGADLSAADKVICVGLGIEKEEDLQLAKDLADVLGAEIGCTRGISEERHWLPVEKYIGISGAAIKPQLYISMGVSGQVQHVVGIRESKIIVAVDTNEKAPIFRAADYGIVGDLYEIIPLLTRALKKDL